MALNLLLVSLLKGGLHRAPFGDRWEARSRSPPLSSETPMTFCERTKRYNDKAKRRNRVRSRGFDENEKKARLRVFFVAGTHWVQVLDVHKCTEHQAIKDA